MKASENYIEINRKLWNKRTKIHIDSKFYDIHSFLQGRSSLNEIELQLLGDIKGKSVLHLQCHFGQDSLSLARMGAKITAVDLSDEAIVKARQLNQELNLDAVFICCDIYELPSMLHQPFDIVFTSYGTIGWLPDMDKWADIVAGFLKPGGTFVFAEFHPVVWMFDNSFNFIQYAYFNDEVIVENEEATYADTTSSVGLTSVGWNHDIGEVLQALINKGLHLEHFKEYNYSPYDIFPGMIEAEPGKFQLEKMKGLLPLVYSLRMTKC